MLVVQARTQAYLSEFLDSTANSSAKSPEPEDKKAGDVWCSSSLPKLLGMNVHGQLHGKQPGDDGLDFSGDSDSFVGATREPAWVLLLAASVPSLGYYSRSNSLSWHGWHRVCDVLLRYGAPKVLEVTRAEGR